MQLTRLFTISIVTSAILSSTAKYTSAQKLSMGFYFARATHCHKEQKLLLKINPDHTFSREYYQIQYFGPEIFTTTGIWKKRRDTLCLIDTLKFRRRIIKAFGKKPYNPADTFVLRQIVFLIRNRRKLTYLSSRDGGNVKDSGTQTFTLYPKQKQMVKEYEVKNGCFCNF